eukprot:2726880-Rhodomonas_salina.1
MVKISPQPERLTVFIMMLPSPLQQTGMAMTGPEAAGRRPGLDWHDNNLMNDGMSFNLYLVWPNL